MILLNGIAVSNSIVNGVLSNIGPFGGGNTAIFAGGIVVDDKSSITATPVRIGLIGISSFSGGISSGATIASGVGICDSTSSFAGGINNTGRITGGNGFSISNISNFSGGASNSGQLITTNYGVPF